MTTLNEAERELIAAQVGPAGVAALLDHARCVEKAEGEVLAHDQQPLDALYLLLDGRLGMQVEVAGHSIQLGEIDPGNWVGEVALFSGSALAVSTVTVHAPARLLVLEFEAFHDLVREAPEIACRLTHVLSEMMMHRLRATINDPILDATGQLLMLGDLSLPLPTHHEHHGVRDFMRSLLGV